MSIRRCTIRWYTIRCYVMRDIDPPHCGAPFHVAIHLQQVDSILFLCMVAMYICMMAFVAPLYIVS